MSDLHRFNGMKILAHADKLDAIAGGDWPPPTPLDWHVYPSNLCNHSCNFCMFIQNKEQEGGEQLPRDLMMRAVAEAHLNGAVLIHFSGGGEPLLNKHTLEAMRFAGALAEDGAASPAHRRLKVALSTNGTLLTPEVAQAVDYIRVSLNAGTAEQHTRTNHAGQPGHKGDFDRIYQNIADAIPSKRGDLGLAFVVDHHNWRDLVTFIQLGEGLGVDFLHIRPAFFYRPDLDAKVRAIMPEAVAECERGKRLVGPRFAARVFALSSAFDGYWTPRSYHSCKAVLTGVCLRATGDFAVCQDRTDLVFGRDPSYKGGATFAECWNSEEHRRVVSCITDEPGGELSKCPRCIWNKRNEIIEAFGDDRMRMSLV